MMNFSVAVLFHTSPMSNPDTHLLWEERMFLVFADSEEDARVQAESIARKHELQYENADGVTVVSRFECVERVCSVSDELSNGCELFSRFLRDSEARSLLQPFDD
jgi:hypothetical protein